MSLRKLFPGEEGIYCNSQNEEREVTIPVDNMAEYQELVELAQKQLNDLSATLNKLNNFSIKMKITF